MIKCIQLPDILNYAYIKVAAVVFSLNELLFNPTLMRFILVGYTTWTVDITVIRWTIGRTTNRSVRRRMGSSEDRVVGMFVKEIVSLTYFRYCVSLFKVQVS